MMFPSNYKPFSENDMTSFPSQSLQDPNFFSAFPNLDSFQLHQHQTDMSMAEGVVAGSRSTTLKKDRHSKINTARGLRDRRMRLSLDVARRFFDLQDMLGFDKASRTVDWLLRSSSSAIGELERAMGVNSTESCISEEHNYCCEQAISTSTSAAVAKKGKVKKREKRRASVARESRRKARERARERTSQKRRLMRENNSNTTPIASQELAQLHFPITDANLPLNSDTIWNSFDFHDTTHNAAFFQQDEQIADQFGFNGKPWETYSF